jgi:hypothetical protein
LRSCRQRKKEKEDLGRWLVEEKESAEKAHAEA